jgi:DNA-binding GntR family transcriptional regulator
VITPPTDRTLTDQVVQQLRKQIILGELLPGERLTEARLSEQLEVSRSTVREALRRLEAESLVEMLSHRGARVAILTLDDAIQISQIHSMLGAHAIRQLELPISSRLQRALQRTADEMYGLHFPEDADRFVELDNQFHRDIFAETRQRRVLQVWSGVSALLGIIVGMSLRVVEVEGATIARRHEEIIEALSQADARIAVRSIEEHYQSNVSRLQRLIHEGQLREGTIQNGRHDVHRLSPAISDSGGAQSGYAAGS